MLCPPSPSLVQVRFRKSHQAALDSAAAAIGGGGGGGDFAVFSVAAVFVGAAVLNLALSALVITLVNGDL